MPILNSIREAEEKAEVLRRDAEAKARVMLEETKIQAEMTVKQMMEASRKEETARNQATEKAIEAARTDIFAKAEAEDRLVSQLAKKRAKEALDFIVKKVLGIMIIKMKKAMIVALREDKEKLLASLQRYGELMPIAQTAEKPSVDTVSEDALLARTEKSIALLKKFQAKRKGFGSQFEVAYETFAASDSKREATLVTIEKADEEITLLKQENGFLAEKIEYYAPWSGLDMKLSELTLPKQAVLRTGIVEMRNLEAFAALIAGYGGILEPLGKINNSVALVYACFKEEDGEIADKAKTIGFSEVSLPAENKMVSEIIIGLENRLTNNESRIVELEKHLAACATRSQEIELLSDQTAATAKRKKTELSETLDTVYLEGWVRSDRLKRLRESITAATEFYDLDFADPAEGEMPPTVTKNNKFVDAFEMITTMFSPPNAFEIDPNPVMSFWYWIIFGMMMGDAGYGLVMVLLIGFLIKKMKPKGNGLRLFRVLFYSGFSTILWGILFGSYFGFTWNPILLEPINQPMEMLILSIVLGVCHIITGLLIKAWHNFRDGHYIAIFADSFSWIFMLVGLGMLFLPATAVIGKWVAILGAAIIVLFAGRSQKNPVARVGLGLYALYGASSYLGDILSYSRILALSLSSAVLGMVMNMLAGMVSGSAIGFVFGIFIFLLGHIFNLAMGLLSAYVHASRLQYIEFFGKFYEGGGTLFRPLEIPLKHIDVLNDQINE